MTTKLLLLKSGENIISDVKELISKDNKNESEKLCGYLLTKPQKLIVNQPFLFEENGEDNKEGMRISMTSWIYLSKDDEIVIPKDWIVTIVEPISEVKTTYEDKINGTKTNKNIVIDQQSDLD